MAFHQLQHRRRDDALNEASFVQSLDTLSGDGGSGDLDAQNSQSTLACDNIDRVNATQTGTDLPPAASSSILPVTDLDSSILSEYPPLISSVILDVKARLCRRRPEDESWKEYPLGVDDWNLLKGFLDNCDWKVRFDYFPRIQTFVHRMPSTGHDSFVLFFYRMTLEKGGRLCAGDPEREEFHHRIVAYGAGNVVGSTSLERHQPDNYIAHGDTLTHGLFLEFAWSQNRNRLPELAEFYLFSNWRRPQMVLGIDCNSLRTKRVTLRTWRRNDSIDGQMGGEVIEYAQELRTEDGVRVPGLPLRVSMLDLAPPQRVPLSLRNEAIEFSVDELCDIIENAEKIQRLVAANDTAQQNEDS